MRGKIVRMKNNARKYRLLAWKKMSTHVEEQSFGEENCEYGRTYI